MWTRLVLDHLTLGTNAFDLSVFDYALWSTLEGPRAGFVPFLGQSLYSHHFMPTLSLLMPLYSLVPPPLLLISVEVASFAAAAFCIASMAGRRLPILAAFALTAAFLLGRRAYGMSSSVFYIECLEPLFIFGLVWSVSTQRLGYYWLFLVLVLGCNENVALYMAAYGFVLMLQRSTRQLGAATMAFSLLWAVVAVEVFIPAARALDGLPLDYAFVAERYGDAPVIESLERLFRFISVQRVVGVLLMTGLIGLLGPKWLLVLAPGVLLNLAARDEAVQSGLIRHYLWPIAPFLFLAAIEGAALLAQRHPRLLRAWAVVLIIGIAADSPVLKPQHFLEAVRLYDRSAAIRADLEAIPMELDVLAQPQLVPHIPKRVSMRAIGMQQLRQPVTAQVVVLSRLGEQWPLTQADFDGIVSRLDADHHYARAETAADLIMFVRTR
ncbi:MAG TPA: DUF2079 domain-containing protein [Vicinamibacterales bacterium]|nr:DUF2079 domain-containing protein [Vicinamibacterales bacterium]